jgi:hypothetical protein
LIWGTIPDFWSISGSGLILGGAIWVAIAKSRIKHDNQDDLERNDYAAVDNEDLDGKDDFELGAISDDDEEVVASSSSSPTTPRSPLRNNSVEVTRDTREAEDMNVVGDGELNELNHWRDDERH